MKALNYRNAEKVSCAGIEITTFLSDCRNYILVSVDDLTDQLGLDVVPEDEGFEEFVLYNKIGQQAKHHCISHEDINDFLYHYDCGESNRNNLRDFRKFFMFEVINFWNRFAPASGSWSIRDAVKVIDIKNKDFHDSIGLPPGRVLQLAVQSLGYKRMPSKEDIPTEELAFIAYSELIYASLAASEMENGATIHQAMKAADDRLQRPLRELGYITRGVCEA